MKRHSDYSGILSLKPSSDLIEPRSFSLDLLHSVFINMMHSFKRAPHISSSWFSGKCYFFKREETYVFFLVENLHPRFFLGQDICHVFFKVSKSV